MRLLVFCANCSRILLSNSLVCTPEKSPDEDMLIGPGPIARQPLLDYVLENRSGASPLFTIKDLNDWFMSFPLARPPPDRKYPGPYRDYLPGTREIKFAHADLHHANIIVESTNPVRVLAIVDWAQSRWYPDY